MAFFIRAVRDDGVDQKLCLFGAVDHLTGCSAAFVEQEDRFQVRGGCRHQSQAVGNRPGHGVLVRAE